MGCFTLGFFEQILIWLVGIAAIFGLVKVLLPLVVGPLGAAGGAVIAALGIILWAIVAIAVIILIFDLLSCLVGGMSVHVLPR